MHMKLGLDVDNKYTSQVEVPIKTQCEQEMKENDLTAVNKEEDDSTLDAVKQFQSRQECHTCMMPKDMESEIVVNNKSVPITATGDGSNAVIKIAPGEGKFLHLS